MPLAYPNLGPADHVIMTCIACDHWPAIPGGLEHRPKLKPRCWFSTSATSCGAGTAAARIDIKD